MYFHWRDKPSTFSTTLIFQSEGRDVVAVNASETIPHRDR
jgi:hypothetical protein